MYEEENDEVKDEEVEDKGNVSNVGGDAQKVSGIMPQLWFPDMGTSYIMHL